MLVVRTQLQQSEFMRLAFVFVSVRSLLQNMFPFCSTFNGLDSVVCSVPELTLETVTPFRHFGRTRTVDIFSYYHVEHQVRIFNPCLNGNKICVFRMELL